MPPVYNPSEDEQRAADLIRQEKTAWERGQIRVSDETSFDMRQEIDDARKNYYGQFESPYDSDTGIKKMFVPMTEWTVETFVKNADVDQKDILVKSANGKNPGVATVVRMLLNSYLHKIDFGEFLNDSLRRLTIDGTLIVKIFEEYNEEFKKNMVTMSVVDPLNFIIDPAAKNIQSGPVIEKSVMTIDEVDRHTDWMNKEFIQFSEDSVPTTEVFERWGKIRLSWVTGREEDKMTYVEGRIVASAGPQKPIAQKNQTPRSQTLNDRIFILHKIERNNRGFKPYEEAWFRRVPSRWHGRGVPEQIKHLQEWMNTVVNIRRDELLNKLTGKYKIRKGAGITKQMIQSLKSGGAIVLDDLDDMVELSERDVRVSSYQEPNEVLSMADRVTGGGELARGEAPLASQAATTSIFQQRGSQSAFANLQENYGLFLERVLRRHVIPALLRELREGEVVRITGELEDLEVIDAAIISFLLQKQEAMFRQEEGRAPTIFERRRLQRKAEQELQNLGKDRWMKIQKFIFDTKFDVEVHVSTNRLDPAVLTRQLQDLLFTVGNLEGVNLDVNAIVKESLDVMGLSGTRFTRKNGNNAAFPTQNNQPPARQTPTPNSEFQRANIQGVLSPNARPTA